MEADPVAWFEDLARHDVPSVGGKNASLGELVRNLAAQGVAVPPGFATRADAYWAFVEKNGLRQVVEGELRALAAGSATLAEAGQAIR
ncbi:MAG: phosphoenolpyruvate synthase, partial [Candidatus Odyssella sp.]|nr:phosphoenolpyruvate synthase [Candidatus Odyssella sp.]